ncbi:unnamed protein product [Heligmosomoides polygyrus]|uniref:DUF3336 domain-containing protein n=1 Tax=Heligmosomoides polygyrus TaxID=6339 RepID=A0A183G5P1_HELPZ|nr:unnamed protein product [Heligmosomoides polygyrus]
MMDYKECKLFYLQYMPQNLINNKSSLSLQYITDWLSIAYLMRDELERRRMGMEAFGGGTCLRASNLGIAPLYATHRKSFAKEQMKNFKIWPQMIAEAAPDIVKSMKHRLLFVENVIRFGGMSKIVKEFISQNREWVDERLKLSDICKQIILGKNQIDDNRLFETVFGSRSDLSPYYQELLFDKEIQIYRDVRQTKAISAQMDHLLGSMALGDDDGLELKLVDYVFNELLRMAPECGKDPYEGLAITNGWKTMIDQGLLKEKSKEHLKMVVRLKPIVIFLTVSIVPFQRQSLYELYFFLIGDNA